MPGRVEDWDKPTDGGKKVCGEDVCDPLEMGATGKGKLQEVVCYRAGMKMVNEQGWGEFGGENIFDPLVISYMQ